MHRGRPAICLKFRTRDGWPQHENANQLEEGGPGVPTSALMPEAK